MAEYESHSDFSDAESISQTDSLVQRAGIKITPRAGRVTRAGQTGLAGSGTKKTAKSKEKDSRTEQPVQAVVQSAKKRKSNGKYGPVVVMANACILVDLFFQYIQYFMLMMNSDGAVIMLGNIADQALGRTVSEMSW